MEKKKKNDFTVIYDEYDPDKPKRKRKTKSTSTMRRFLPIVAIFAAAALVVLGAFATQTDGRRRENVSLAAFLEDPGTPYPTATFSAGVTAQYLTPVLVQPTVIAKRIDDMAWSPVNHRLAVSIWDPGQSNIQLMDVAFADGDNLLPQQTIWLSVPSDQITDLTFNDDGTLLAATGLMTLRVWDVATGALQVVNVGSGSPAFAPDSRLLAFSSPVNVTAPYGDHMLKLLNMNSGSESLLPGIPGAYSADFSPDGQKLAVSDNNRVLLWDINDTQSPQWTQPVTEGWIRDIAFNPDGSLLAVASNNQIAVFTVEGSHHLSLQSPLGEVWGIAFSPDGTRLAAAVGDHASGMVQVWDANSGVPILALQGHRHRVTGIAYNADGTRLITSSFDGSVRLWDTATGAELSTLQL